MRFLYIKPPHKNEYSVANSVALFSSLITRTPRKGLLSIFGGGVPEPIYSFNYVSINQTIYFVVGATENDYAHLKNQILAQFGRADLIELDNFSQLLPVDLDNIDFAEIVPAQSYYLPIKNFDASEADPLSSILSAMSRSPDPNAFFWIQIILKPAGSTWQTNAIARINKLNAAETTTQAKQMEVSMIQEKIKYHGFYVNIRAITDNPANTGILQSAFSIYARPSGNQLKGGKPGIFRYSKVHEAIKNHSTNSPYVLNTLEVSNIWHLPNTQINIPNISWGKRLTLDTPENLPIAYEGMSDEEKKNLTFIGKTEYKNREAVFGIKAKDRLRHVYIVGKTGSGKSWMINNMAIEDIRKGAGVAVLDPHGDAIDAILEYIPKSRINDVCYFNPSDPDYAYPLNILEVYNESQKEIIVSGIIAIFHKLYANSWGPRLEHILRNVLFTLVYAENTTLPDVMKIMHSKKYRNKILERVKDPMIHQFWKNEFDTMSDNFKNEAISPILNKVGQFVTSPMIRKVVAYQKSKVRIQDLMDNRKIFLCDLSQGKLGEDNAALLGSMLITQIQISAMNRAFISEDQRVPFYLYVDEFQNFATSSFSKILSEARKYKLGLILANQYITQIDESVMGAILGNIGNITTFNIGAKDAEILHKEFGTEIEPEDLTSMNKFQMLTRITVDNAMTKSFSCYSLPLPKNVSGHREKIIEQSRKRYGIDIKGKEAENLMDDMEALEISTAGITSEHENTDPQNIQTPHPEPKKVEQSRGAQKNPQHPQQNQTKKAQNQTSIPDKALNQTRSDMDKKNNTLNLNASNVAKTVTGNKIPEYMSKPENTTHGHETNKNIQKNEHPKQQIHDKIVQSPKDSEENKPHMPNVRQSNTIINLK